MSRYTPAPDVKEIAQELIPQYHPSLVDARIEYVYDSKVPKKGAKEVWGSMRKISALPAYLAAPENAQSGGAAEDFFVMTISKPVWEDLEHKDKVALVDHELCHALVKIDEDTGETKLYVVPHDLEEFTAIVQRHGLWREDVKRFFDAKDQLPDAEDEESDTQVEDGE